MTMEAIYHQALSLPVEQRAILVEKINESLAEKLDVISADSIFESYRITRIW
jgi:hypothetical protein